MPEAPTGLVTGANSGIGKQITRLRAQGYPIPDDHVP